MQEFAGDRGGEGWEGYRLLPSIKEGGHPDPGAGCCVHACVSSWAIVLERRLVPRETSEVWGWCAAEQSSQPFDEGPVSPAT